MKRWAFLVALAITIVAFGNKMFRNHFVERTLSDAIDASAVGSLSTIQSPSGLNSTGRIDGPSNEYEGASRDVFAEQMKDSDSNDTMTAGERTKKEEYEEPAWLPGPHLSKKEVSSFNDAMDRELEADEIAEDFGARMEGLFHDKGADEMVRNFAVQHLERFAQERTVRGTWDVDSEEAEKVRTALEDAALEVDNSIGGTAMLALARLSEIDPHVDRRRLSSRSSSLVANPSTRLSTRIAAAQLCGLLRVRSALPALLSLSADSSVPTPLRLAAAHAAGLVSESR